MKIDDLASVMAQHFGWADVRPDSLLEELGADSLDIVEILELLDVQSVHQLDEATVSGLRTVRDVHALYEARRDHS